MSHGIRVPSDGTRGQVLELVHDLRQPIACIRALANGCQAELGDDSPLASQLAGIDKQVSMLLGMVDSLLDAPSERQESTELAHVIHDAVEVTRLTRSATVSTDETTSTCRSVRGREVTLRRALANVLDNAARSAGPEGHVLVSVEDVGDVAVVAVDDDGPGFGAVAPQRLLGLRSALHCLRASGGSLRVDISESLGGARVLLRLPLGDEVTQRTAGG